MILDLKKSKFLRTSCNMCILNELVCSRIFIVIVKVAWIKADTKAILAIHEHVITNNARLSVTHNDYNTWTLNIRGVKREDRGQYMCQVNTDPMKMQVCKKYQLQNKYLLRFCNIT